MEKYCGIKSSDFKKYLESFPLGGFSGDEILLNHNPIKNSFSVNERIAICRKRNNGKFSVGSFYKRNGKIVFKPFDEIWFDELLFYKSCGIEIDGPDWLKQIKEYNAEFDEKYCIGSCYGEPIDAPIRVHNHSFFSSEPWLDHPISQWY